MTIKAIRCVHLDTNKVKYFPHSICMSPHWQKTTRYVPQDIACMPTIINNTSDAVAASAANEISNATEIATAADNNTASLPSE